MPDGAGAPEDAGRLDVAGVGIDVLTRDQAMARIEALVAAPEPSLVAFVNAHTVNVAATDPAFRAVLSDAALVLNDGAGMALGGRLLGRPFPENLNGSDLMPLVLDLAAARGWGVFFLGGRDGVAASAAALLQESRPRLRICGTRHGHFPPSESAAVAAAIRETGAELVLVAMGNPKQELWLARWLPATGASAGFGVGAFFDFQSGRVSRAPAWMNRLGIEWAFRLALEPRRLARRYLVGNPLFLARVAPAAARRRLGRR